MGKYKVALSDRAKTHLSEWKKSGQHAGIKKIEKIIEELSETPYAGVGLPEPLKYDLSECWSRRIDKKNRIIYQVNEETVSVIVVSAKGHYGDK